MTAVRSRTTLRALAVALALVLLGGAGATRAQGAPSFAWELLGLETEPLEGLFFAPGPVAPPPRAP